MDISRTDLSSRSGAAPVGRVWGLRVSLEAVAPSARPAPRPAPRPFVPALDHLLVDGAAAPRARSARAREALRAFTAGDGFLPGQIIDRII